MKAAVVSLLAAIFVAACDDSATPALVGHLNLSVGVDPALPVKAIKYDIKRDGRVILSGFIPVDDLGRAGTTNVRGLLVGGGYTVVATATSMQANVTCDTAASAFEVKRAETTKVYAPLTCRSDKGLVISTDAHIYCPLIKSSAVAPVQTSVGGSVAVSVTAAQTDGGMVSFSWTSVDGVFLVPSASKTIYRCAKPGDQSLIVIATAGRCSDLAALKVNCVELACGNGEIDPGETCDDGNRSDADDCPSDCLLPACGNGKIDANETCEPPGTDSCDSMCRKIGGCGNGLIDSDEQCDDANLVAGDGCFACKLEALCGNGLVEPGEECEPPSAGTCNAVCRLGPVQ